MEFSILGPLRVLDGDVELPIGSAKERALLAALLLRPGAVVSRECLIDDLWGESPPPSATKALNVHVSQLRKRLTPNGQGSIETRPPGYALDVGPEQLDALRFERLVAEARDRIDARQLEPATRLLQDALALWRGAALSDVELEAAARIEINRLDERRLSAQMDRIDCELALGRHEQLIAELEALVAQHPLRERLRGQYMLALYRAGRQANALGAYQEARKTLIDELGLEPSEALQRLERGILNHDPALELPAGIARPHDAGPAKRQRSREWAIVPAAIVIAAAIVAIGAGIAAGIELGTGTTSATTAATGLAELDAHSAALIGRLPQRDWPAAIAADPSSLWLAEPSASEVVRVDRTTRRVIEEVPVSGTPALVAVGGGAAWVASDLGGTLTRIDPMTYATNAIGLGGAHAAALAYGYGSLWVADPTDAELIAIDPASGDVVRRLQVDVHPTALAVGAGALWLADYDAGSVTEIDPQSGKPIATVAVGHGPAALAFADGSVWVANSLDDTVSRIDPASGRVVATRTVGDEPVALAADDNSVLVANEYSSSVSRIDPRRNVVAGRWAVGSAPTALAFAGSRIWVGTRALGEHRGGTLVLLHTHPLSLDPALQHELPPSQSNGLTYDALLTSVLVGGEEQLVPDLAENVPTPTDNGTTYIFRLRRGIHYSDGRAVRAGDFRRAIERLFRVRSAWSGTYTNIVGAGACTVRRCDLAQGIVTDDTARTITFHLVTPDGNFPSTMTSMATAPVPPGTPFHPLVATAIPGTGPYVVKSANEHEIRYVRNPHFSEWSHAAQPDGNPDVIVTRYGLTPTQEARTVESGKADWSADGVPAALQREVMTRYPAQLHYLPIGETDFFRLNTTQAPFNDLRVRQALNLAIDRAAIVRMYGPAVSFPTCQVLPPSFLGYQRYCPYTRNPRPGGGWTAPDLAGAQRLIAASGTRGEHVTVWGDKDAGTIGTTVVRYTVRLLDRLGYRARARIVPPNVWDLHPQVFRKMQLISSNWAFGTTFEFVDNALACDTPNNTHFFCNHRLDRAFREANTLEANNPSAAAIQWAQIDRELVEQAAWVPLVNIRWVDFVSARVHNYQADPTLGLIADQVSLR